MIRVDQDTMEEILSGKVVQLEHKTTSSMLQGESYPVAIYEETGVEIQLVKVAMKPRRRPVRMLAEDGKRTPKGKSAETYLITAVRDDSGAVQTLRAESGGAAIAPLGDSHSETELEAHGVVNAAEDAGSLEDAGEGVDHDLVEASAISQANARRFASERVQTLGKRRARSMANRVQDAFAQATAHGLDQREAIAVIDQVLKQLHAEIREAARAA